MALALALSRTLSAAEPAGFVTPVAIDQLVQNPADFFDLEGKTVRFTPSVDVLTRSRQSLERTWFYAIGC